MTQNTSSDTSGFNYVIMINQDIPILKYNNNVLLKLCECGIGSIENFY